MDIDDPVVTLARHRLSHALATVRAVADELAPHGFNVHLCTTRYDPFPASDVGYSISSSAEARKIAAELIAAADKLDEGWR